MNFERITKVYREETQRKTLTSLEPDFWEKVARYLGHLESELAASRAKDPNAKAAMLLQDELRKVQQKREQIYQYRERKIAQLASQVVGGAVSEIKGLARVEYDLLRRLVDLMREARASAYGHAEPPAAGPPLSPGLPKPATPTLPAKIAEPTAKGILLHILEDVPPFAGPDGTLRLRKEDLVTVDPTIARVLVERGKARPVSAPV